MNNLVPKALAEKMSEWRKAAVKWKPHPYQGRSLKFVLEKQFSGLLLDPGMGKTSIMLACIKILLGQKLVKRVLVVAPKRAIYNVWPAEMCDWTDFHDIGFALLHGLNKESILRALRPEHQVVLINPEGFQWLTASKERARLLGADMLVIDESSKWKNSNSVRFKCLKPMLASFKRRYILTGSPRPRNYLDLFGQMYIIDRGAALGQYITHYRNEYFYPTGYQMREWAPLPDSPARINAKVAPLVLRLDAKDYLKLPGTPDRVHKIELPDKVQKEYDRIEETLMSTLFDAPLQNSASARSKCCQIANGAVYLDGWSEDRARSGHRPVKTMHTAKTDALMDLYEELQGEPLLISVGYHHDVAAIKKAMNWEVPVINSGTTERQADKNIEDWNNGLLAAMMLHPASGGHALNLQKFNCRHVVFYDIPDDYDLYDQIFRRIWRQGNKAAYVMRHHLVAQNTVDVAKMRNLARKGNGQKDFLNAMKEYSDAKYKGRKR